VGTCQSLPPPPPRLRHWSSAQSGLHDNPTSSARVQQQLIAASPATGRRVDDGRRRWWSAGSTDVCVTVEAGSWQRRVLVAEWQRRVVLTQVGRLTLTTGRHVVVTGIGVDGTRFRQRLQSSQSTTIHAVTNYTSGVARWCSGQGVRLVLARSRVRLPTVALTGSLGQLSLLSFRLGKSSSLPAYGLGLGRGAFTCVG